MAKRKLDNVPTDDLQAELARRDRRLGTLQRKRQRVLDQLNEVEQEIMELGGTPGARTKSASQRKKTDARPKNKMSLPDALAKVMSTSNPMGVSEAAEAVQKAGYKTNSKNFTTIVNQTLIKDDRFEQVSRGKYKLA